MARSSSIVEELKHVKDGTVMCKIRDKGVRGLKLYRRKYRLDMDKLRITYLPNKAMISSGKNCVAPTGQDNKAQIDLMDIAEIREGHGTDTFNKVSKSPSCSLEGVDCKGKLCLSIIFQDDTPPLDLVVNDESTRNAWVNVLSHLVMTIRSLEQQNEFELYLRKQFKEADKNGNGSLSLDECIDLTKQLNIKMEKDDIRDLFKQANNEEDKVLDDTEFVQFYYSLLKRPELDSIFQKYASKQPNGPRITTEDLVRFFLEEQKSDQLAEECSQLIKAFEPTKDKSSLSPEGFTQFMMFSKLHNIVDERPRIYQDMNQPLSHYWIASSHNT